MSAAPPSATRSGVAVAENPQAPAGAHAAALALIAGLTVTVFWPTLRNGFLPLGFDDAIITDTPAIRALTWPNLVTLFTTFNQAHYVPVTLLSFGLDYHFWGLSPAGYHLTNVVLHTLGAMLVYGFVWSLLPSVPAALLAALVFAVHPVQMEAVSVAMQRKSVLSGVWFFVAVLAFRRWSHTRRTRWYAAALTAFVVAALAKPDVVTLPLLLVLCEVTAGERPRLADKLPFVAVAAAVAAATVAAHAAVSGLHGPHGGTWIANLLMVGRVTLEYVDALLLPLALSPIYYYRQAVVYSPVNIAALALIAGACAWVTWNRERDRWSFFAVWWFVLALLPASNLVPLAQLRADRFLYLSVVGFGVWLAVACTRAAAGAARGRWRLVPWGLGAALIGVYAVVCHGTAATWRDDVSAWQRVVVRHPWCAVAHVMLGRAYHDGGDEMQAERQLTTALDLSTGVPDAYLYLAKVYAAEGRAPRARAVLRRFLTLTPGDPEGLEMLAALPTTDGSE